MRTFAAALMLLGLLVPCAAHADWPADGVVVGWSKWFTDVRLESDGAGRIAAFSTAHSQTYSVLGVRAISTDGVPAPAGFGGEGVQLFADGAGGVFAVGSGGTGFTMQHFDSTGAQDPAWLAGGSPLPTSVYFASAVVSDGSGGAYLAYGNPVAGLQRYDATGNVAAGWPAGGLALDSGVPTASNASPAVIVDASHRATVLYYDHANMLVTRRVLPDGTLDPAWTGGAYSVAGTAVNLRGFVRSGGVLYAWWADFGSAHIALLDSHGVLVPGWPVVAARGDDMPGYGPAGPWSQDPARITVFADDGGGLYLFCMPGTAPDTVVATHLLVNGLAASGWSLPAAPVTLPAIADPVRAAYYAGSDGLGGALYGWSSGLTRFMPGGSLAPGWSGAGDMVAPDSTMRLSTSCSLASVHVDARAALGDGTGAALLAFVVSDCSYYSQNVRVMRFTPAGLAGVGPVAPRTALGVTLLGANPAAGMRRFALTADASAPAVFDVLDVAGRVVSREHVAAGATARERTWSPTATSHAGVYFARLTQRGASRAARFVVLE